MSKELNKNIYKIIVSFILTILLVNNCFAQQLTMSSIGVLDKTSSLSTALNFKSNTNCIDVQSGIMVLNGYKGFGEFVANCLVTQQFNTLGAKLYPNPVKTFTKLKFTSTPSLTELFNISVWNAEGNHIKSISATGYQILQGMLLDFSNIPTGGYFLKVESPQYIEALKFIKVN